MIDINKHEILLELQKLKKEKHELEMRDLSSDNSKNKSELNNINEKIQKLEWYIQPNKNADISSFKSNNIEIDLA